MENNSNGLLIKKIIDLFGEPDENEFAKDIENAKKIQKKSKSLISILSKYEKKKLNKETCKFILSDVVSSLLKDREDFPILIDIYMNTIDDLVADCLRRHYILKKTIPKKMDDDETSNGCVKFSISLSCLDNDDKFYHKFIKGMFQYFQLCFENNYLYEYLQKKYFKNMEKSKEYNANISSIIFSLNKMLEDMRRIITSESNQKVSLQEKDIINKMTNNKYKTLCIRAQAHKIDIINKVLDIYNKCNNNNEIFNEIKKLYENNSKVDELLVLQDLVQEYLKNEEREKYTKNLEKSMALKDTELYSNSKDIQELKTNINTLIVKNNKLEEKVNELKQKDIKNSNEINKLKKKADKFTEKLDFMEPILISLISRKVINYSICKILNNYKKKISITVEYDDKNKQKYNISFLDSVNEVKMVDANNLLDMLFEKKTLYNVDSHLEGKELPSFIPDIWDLVKKNFNFQKKELVDAFDGIITEDIKSGFNLGAHDLSVNDYLKNVNREEFGSFNEINNN